MTGTEFHAIVTEMLIDPWGDKHYPRPVLDRLWRQVRVISAGEFRRSLDTLMMTTVRAPALGQVIGSCRPAINQALDEARRQRIESLGSHTCHLCGGSGWVQVIPFDNPLGDGSFVCTKCEAANVRGITTSRGARLWEDDFEHRYFVRRFTRQSAREYAALMEKHYDEVRGLPRKQKRRGVLPGGSPQEWAQRLLQGVRAGEGAGEVLRQSLDLSGPDSDA